MQARKLTLLAVILSARFFANAQEEAKASVSAALTNAASRLEINVRQEGGPGLVPCRRAYLSTGPDRMAFLIPEGFDLDSSDSQKLALRRPGGGVITIRIVAPPGGTPPQPSEYRQRLAGENAGVRIIEEFALMAAGVAGPAFDTRFVSAAGLPRACRVAFIPLRAGVVELRLETNPEKFDEALACLHYVMVTFRASEDGKLEATPLPDRI
jgi:hypothetical protein